MLKRILDDPRNFWRGPITLPSGIPTRTLAAGAKANGVASTARWHECEVAEVRAAVRFERRRKKCKR